MECKILTKIQNLHAALSKHYIIIIFSYSLLCRVEDTTRVSFDKQVASCLNLYYYQMQLFMISNLHS